MLRTVAIVMGLGLAACGETVDAEARRQVADLREIVEGQRLTIDALAKAEAARNAPKKWWCTADPADLSSGLCYEPKAHCDDHRRHMATNGRPGYVDCYGQAEVVCVTVVIHHAAGQRPGQICSPSAGSCEALRRELVRRGGNVSACELTR